MLGVSVVFLSFDVRRAFPSLDLLLSLLAYDCMGMTEKWQRARARLWGMVQWDLEE
eukprot:gene46316-4138_t